MEHHFVLKLKYLVETYNNLTSGKLISNADGLRGTTNE